MQIKTIDWINYNLDEAMSRLLSFTGEDLFNLMLDVRANLAQRNTELIILIESFSMGIVKSIAFLEGCVY